MKPISTQCCRASAACGAHGAMSCLPMRSCCSHSTSSLQSCGRSKVCSTHMYSCISSQQPGGAKPRSTQVIAACQPPSSSIHSTENVQQQHLQQQRQHSVQQAATPTASVSTANTGLPFAALSRVLLTSSNANVFKSLTQRRQPVSGPMGVLLFLATLIAASFAAIRSLLMKRGKSCKTCRAFGLQRCRLCLGSGRVDWAAKLKHFDVCPLCMNRRFTVCSECGGHYHRTMFAHRRRQAGGAFEPDSRTSTASSGSDQGSFQGPIVLNMAAAGAAAGGVTVVTSGVSVTSGSINPVLSSMSD